MKHTSLLLCASIIALTAMPVMAEQLSREDLESMVLELRAEVQELRGMVQGIDAEQQILSERTTQALDRTASYQAGDWMDTTSISGDLRLSYNYYDVDDSYFGYDDSYDTFNARARLMFTTEFSEDLTLGMRLVTGADALTDDEVFGAFDADQDYVWFDQYFAQWTPNEWLTAVGGKFNNPFVSTAMVFDKERSVPFESPTDVQPEGFAQIFMFGDETFDARLILGEVLFEEYGGEIGDDLWMLAGQIGAYIAIGEDWQLDAFLGYYDFTSEIEKNTTFYGTNGNHNVGGVRTDDFNIIQPYLALHFNGVEDVPMVFYGEYVNNLDANGDEQGARLGAQFGKAEEEGSWEIGGFYQLLEANAVLDLMTDSDFHRGGTNNEGFGISAAYAIRDNWVARISGLFAEEDNGPDAEWNNIIVDMTWNF